MTQRSATALLGRLLRAVLGAILCAFVFAAGAPATADGLRVGLPGTSLEQAVDPLHDALPALHADAAMLDLEDSSGDERFAAPATAAERLRAGLTPVPAAADPPRDVGLPLPERPPRG